MRARSTLRACLATGSTLVALAACATFSASESGDAGSDAATPDTGSADAAVPPVTATDACARPDGRSDCSTCTAASSICCLEPKRFTCTGGGDLCAGVSIGCLSKNDCGGTRVCCLSLAGVTPSACTYSITPGALATGKCADTCEVNHVLCDSDGQCASGRCVRAKVAGAAEDVNLGLCAAP